MKQKTFTNCFLVRIDNKGCIKDVCLGLKKRGFGKDMWNGSGGKPEEGETVEAAAKREVQEEFGVKVAKLDKRGEIVFILREERKSVLMHVFLVTDWIDEPIETEEMQPHWFPVGKVPYQDMWASDKEWLPIILTGKKIKAKYTYAREGGNVQARELREVKVLLN